MNQFDVQSRLEGLEEKFAVLNRDTLADALKLRRDELAKQSTRWTPEILSLLLTLSDRPAEKTDLSVLDQKDENVDAFPQLTWADIIAEDPLTEEGIWDDVAIESDLSDEDFGQLSDDSLEEDHTVSTQTSSLGEEDIAAFARAFIVPRNDDSTKPTHYSLHQSVPDRHNAPTTQISELEAVREALLMLRGLRTSLFTSGPQPNIKLQPQFSTSVCESLKFSQVMGNFATLGSQVNHLRVWTLTPLEGALPQRLKASVQSRISKFERHLAEIEQHFLDPHHDVVVSMSEILYKVLALASPLVHLSKAIITGESGAYTWSILDRLYGTACDLQFGENFDTFVDIAYVFFECLEIYLRPVHLWMTQGKLQEENNDFFVRSTDGDVDQNSLWHSQFTLSRDEHHAVKAPAFMQDAVYQIFVSGKSTMFLEALQHESVRTDLTATRMQDLDSSSIISSLQDSLLSFAGVFDVQLRHWIGALQTHSMLSLRQALYSQCGLQDTLNVIQDLFLAMDGARFQNFADEIFHRINRNGPWTDRFIITDLAQNTLGSSKNIEAERLTLRVQRRQSGLNTQDTITEALDRVLIYYSVPWPVKNIIRSFNTCRRAWLESLRVYRAEYLLKKQQWTIPLARECASETMSRALVLRQRLVWFTNIYRGHVADINFTTMKEFRTELEKAPDVDRMASAYDDFQQSLQTKLLLHKNLRTIHEAFIDILGICEDFAVVWSRLVERTNTVSLKQSERPSSDSGGESDDEADTESADQLQTVRDLPTLAKDYEAQLHFAIAGLRGVSRVGGEPSWISLAERLQLGVEHMNKG